MAVTTNCVSLPQFYMRLSRQCEKGYEIYMDEAKKRQGSYS